MGIQAETQVRALSENRADGGIAVQSDTHFLGFYRDSLVYPDHGCDDEAFRRV